jgi:hypothetical protein
VDFTRTPITIRTAVPPEKREREGFFLREHIISAMIAEGCNLAYYQPLLCTALGFILRRRHIRAYQITSTDGAILVGNPLPTDEATAQECIRFLSTRPQVTQGEIEDYASNGQGQWYRLEQLSDEEREACAERRAMNRALTELHALGYRDVTELVRPYYQDEAPYYEDLYLCTLQRPNGEPLYCQTAQQLFTAVETARAEHQPRSAPEPGQSLIWTLVVNFNPEEDETHGL